MHIISLGKSDFNEWLGKSGGKFRASEHPDASKLRGGLAALLKNNGILENEAAARVAQALGGFVDYKAALAAYREEKGLGKKDEEKTPEPELALERDSSNFERVDEPQPNVAMRRADKILFQHLAPLFDLDIYSHFGWNAPQVSPALLSHLPLSSIFLDLASANRIHAALRNALYAERERQKSSSRNQLRKKVEVLVTQSYSTFGSDTALSGLDDEQLDSLSELVFSSIHVGEGKTLVHGRSLGVPPVSLPHIQQFQSQLSLPEGNEREALEKLVYALDALHIQHESMINSSSLAMNNLLHNPHKIFEGLVGGKPYSFSSSEAFAAYSVLNNMLATRRNFISDLRNAMDHSRSQISR